MYGEKVKIGQGIKVVDEHGVQHDGLCVANHWSGDEEPTHEITVANVTYVSKDPNKTDNYGRQKEMIMSCSHRDSTTAPGRYWFIEGGRKASNTVV